MLLNYLHHLEAPHIGRPDQSPWVKTGKLPAPLWEHMQHFKIDRKPCEECTAKNPGKDVYHYSSWNPHNEEHTQRPEWIPKWRYEDDER